MIRIPIKQPGIEGLKWELKKPTTNMDTGKRSLVYLEESQLVGESNCDMMCFFVEGVMILVGVDVDNFLKIMIDFNDSPKTIVLYRICADICMYMYIIFIFG